VPHRISADGSHVIAQSFGAFAGTEDDPSGNGGQNGASYEFSRTGSGWMTEALTPSAKSFAENFSKTEQLVSSEFGTITWVLNPASQQARQRDLYLRMPDGALKLVGPLTPTPPAEIEGDDNFILAGSSDLSHVLFDLRENRWPGDTTFAGSNSLYESTVGAGFQEPKLVGVKNEGPLASNAEAELISQCGTEFSEPGSYYFNGVRVNRGVSASGRVVFFTALECGGSPQVNELYARIEGSKTTAISEPSLSVPGRECTGVCREDENEENGHKRQEASFQGASEDGSKVFFTTTQPLLNGDGDTTTDLYEAEVTSSGIQRLIQVSMGDPSDATQGSGAGVLSVSAISNDGSRAYFVAEGVLTTAKNNQGQGAAAGAPNLYMVEPASGHTTFIATLSSSFAESPTLTADGRFLVFASAGQLFEYDSRTGTLVSVASDEGREAYVSNDGSYVVFSSSAALTPQALNDPPVLNVYEYHNGQVSLISDGKDVFPSEAGVGAQLVGMDASGENIFFETNDSLVSQHTDTQVALYDARIGGGFPAIVSPANCSGDGCQGPLSATPPASPVGSTGAAEGNLAPPVFKPVSKPLTRAQKLAKALKACKKKPKKRRPACKKEARRAYGPAHKATKSRKGGK
jgi:hypothetical protein